MKNRKIPIEMFDGSEPISLFLARQESKLSANNFARTVLKNAGECDWHIAGFQPFDTPCSLIVPEPFDASKRERALQLVSVKMLFAQFARAMLVWDDEQKGVQKQGQYWDVLIIDAATASAYRFRCGATWVLLESVYEVDELPGVVTQGSFVVRFGQDGSITANQAAMPELA